MKYEEVQEKLKGLGTSQDIMYTNDEIIAKLDELQLTMASILRETGSFVSQKSKDIVNEVQQRAYERGLEATAELERFDRNMDKLGRQIGILVKGRNGERNASRALTLLELDKDVHILYNITLQDGDFQTEYDAVALTPYGVFMVEVKNYNDDMYIAENGMLYDYNERIRPYNLGWRMNCKELLLRKALGLLGENYHGMLLFANNDARLEDDYHQVQISYLNTIVRDIKVYDHGKVIFTEKQLTKMEEKLRMLDSPRKYPCAVRCSEMR